MSAKQNTDGNSPTAHVSASPGEAPGSTVVKRTLLINISGSLANLALAGPQAAMWKGLQGREQALFCPMLGVEAADPAEQTNSIRNGLIRRVEILEHQSTFPCTLGVSLSCVPPSEVTNTAEGYTFTVLPRSKLSSPQTVYECDSSIKENAAWRQQYGKWNKTNLESEGVMDVNGKPYVFVHMDHPAIGLLRHNADIIGCDIDTQQKIDNNLYKLSRQILASCCQTLRTKVLSKVLTQDLNMFTVQLHRLNAESWDDLGDGTVALQGFKMRSRWTPEEADAEKEHHLRQFVTTPYSYIARLRVEYEIPTGGGN